MYTIGILTSIHPDFDKRVWRHARSLASSGMDVHLICPWNIPSGTMVEGVHIISFKPVKGRAARLFKLPYRMTPLIARMILHVDILHFHDIDLLPLMMVARFVRPVVYDVHENYPDEMLVRHWVPNSLRKPLYWIVRYGQYLASLVVRNIVLVVPDQERDFPKRFIRKIQLRNYASRFLLEQVKTDYLRRPRRVIFTGSQYPENGTFLVLDIAERLKTSGVEVELLCSDRFADATLKEEFLNCIEAKGLRRHVKLIPNVPAPEIMGVLNQARVGLVANLRVPKQIKALPTRLFEYMAAGLPVVASDLPLIVKYLDESNCGMLAQPEDPETFASAITRLLDDEALALDMSRRGQAAFADRFSWEGQIPSLIKFYEAILEK
jgi:glycosyltransferase involved in cell wall biosynthesis